MSYHDGHSRTSHISQSFLGSVNYHLFKKSVKETNTDSEFISAQGGGLAVTCLHWTYVSSQAGSGMRRHWDPWLQCNGPVGSRSRPLCFYCKYQTLIPLHLLLSETLGLSTAIVIIVISFDKKVGQCKEENRECRRILQEQGRVEDTRAQGGKRAGHSRMRR